MLRMPKGDTTWGTFGHVESNGVCFQKLGRSSKASKYYFSLELSGTCADSLAMLISKADHMLMNLVDCGRARAALALQ